MVYEMVYPQTSTLTRSVLPEGRIMYSIAGFKEQVKEFCLYVEIKKRHERILGYNFVQQTGGPWGVAPTTDFVFE
jgi:hypothetical protein